MCFASAASNANLPPLTSCSSPRWKSACAAWLIQAAAQDSLSHVLILGGVRGSSGRAGTGQWGVHHWVLLPRVPFRKHRWRSAEAVWFLYLTAGIAFSDVKCQEGRVQRKSPVATSPSQSISRQQSRPTPSAAHRRLIAVISLCTTAVGSPSTGVGDRAMDVARSPSSLALPKCFLQAGSLPGATSTAKGNRCWCSQASSSVPQSLLQQLTPGRVPRGKGYVEARVGKEQKGSNPGTTPTQQNLSKPGSLRVGQSSGEG